MCSPSFFLSSENSFAWNLVDGVDNFSNLWRSCWRSWSWGFWKKSSYRWRNKKSGKKSNIFCTHSSKSLALSASWYFDVSVIFSMQINVSLCQRRRSFECLVFINECYANEVLLWIEYVVDESERLVEYLFRINNRAIIKEAVIYEKYGISSRFRTKFVGNPEFISSLVSPNESQIF